MEQLIFHDWLINYIKNVLKNKYKDIKANIGKKEFEYKGHYPDIILQSGGFTIGIVEVITKTKINNEEIERWKQLAMLDTKLILLIPEHLKKKIADILWKERLMEKVSIATYEIKLKGL